MKKIYMTPGTEVVTVAGKMTILAGSPQGFDNPVDEDPMDPDDMLSRRRSRSQWDDEDDEQDY